MYVCTLYILYHIIRSPLLHAILRAILRPARAKSHSIKRKEAQRLQNCEFACTKHFQPRPNRIGNVRAFQVRTNWIYSNHEFILRSKPIAWHMFPFLRSSFHPLNSRDNVLWLLIKLIVTKYDLRYSRLVIIVNICPNVLELATKLDKQLRSIEHVRKEKNKKSAARVWKLSCDTKLGRATR